jgi:hypothetical protein
MMNCAIIVLLQNTACNSIDTVKNFLMYLREDNFDRKTFYVIKENKSVIREW